MSICAKCPAYYPTHTPDGEERMGVCRFEPPVVFRRFVKAKNPVDGSEVDMPVYDSAWPPTTDSKWCVRGRMLMELKDQIPRTSLTADLRTVRPIRR